MRSALLKTRPTLAGLPQRSAGLLKNHTAPPLPPPAPPGPPPPPALAADAGADIRAGPMPAVGSVPASNPFVRVPLCAARTLNAAGQSRVTLSLRQQENSRAALRAVAGGQGGLHSSALLWLSQARAPAARLRGPLHRGNLLGHPHGGETSAPCPPCVWGAAATLQQSRSQHQHPRSE